MLREDIKKFLSASFGNDVVIKDIKKFDTASMLMVYSGLASINGMPVNKVNLNKIKEVRAKTEIMQLVFLLRIEESKPHIE